ncbi:ABC transporter ATP-binding protein [Natronolimnobius sp. AArcel1]|uniref:ABC transporter ATP-binding protein n=1 Tax=Natronolimnobius sp. AArcel1 TaxID=1679093 RepID=UPI0013EB651D|nr:ABC transporter ATP-binding protein [Natronolimnobius sp. AArcel1]NGM70038.1 ABC transporter ATP-binding protein [Natronolimnobius sp. AArcel1]
MSDDPGREGEGEIAAAADERWPLVALLREHGRGDLKWLGLGSASSAGSQFLSNIDMLIIGLAFDAMFNDEPYALFLVPDVWIPADPTGQLLFTVALLAGIKVIDMGLAIFSLWALFLFGQRTIHRVRVAVYDDVQRLDAGFFDDQRTGEVMSVLNNDVNSLEESLTQGPNLAVFATTTVVSSLLYMLILNWQLALLPLTLVPIVAIVNWWFSRKHEQRNDEVREETGVVNALLETNVSGVSTVKAFGGERYETGRVREASDAYREASWYAHIVGVLHQPSMRLLAGVAFVLTLFVGTEWVLDERFWIFAGTITAGELIPFLYYTQQLAQPMRFLAWVTGLYKAGKAAAKRVLGLRQLSPPRDDGDHVLKDPRGAVQFDDVTFGYDAEDADPVLRDISVDVEPGETVGLVGHTGAGKSTLLKLLLAYYEPGKGRITVDGHDLQDVSRSSLRQSIGYVRQDPFLFSGTVRENIAYGLDDPADGDSTVSDNDIVAAAREAGAHEFITELDDGYDTEVGQRGVRLSGGQRQRIALARVLLTDPAMFVFDEATSHVDNRTEVLIQRSLDRLTAEKTTFIVAHRLSTVRNADRILVLDDGEIVERGTHDDLLECDGTYADLWKVQVGELDAD